MRLIDADALLDKLDIRDLPIVLTHVIDTFPTVDAVPVVRCKDCKYWKGENEFCGLLGGPNDYCSWGRRKDDTK